MKTRNAVSNNVFQPCKYSHIFRAGCRQGLVTLAACLLFSGIIAAQDPSASTSRPDLPLPSLTGVPLRSAFLPVAGVSTNNAPPAAGGPAGQPYSGGLFFAPNSGDAPAGVVRITLEEAQERAAGANSPLLRLAALQVEAAVQHRKGVQAQYFPNISSSMENLHFNKATGRIERPLAGIVVPVNLIAKNQTGVNVSAVQPVTPLFAIHQLVKIARADENIAKAKAGMPVAETSRRVEKNYYELLVAERELISAEAEATKVQGKWLTASSSGAPRISTEQETEMIGAEKAVVLSASKAKELTASLNEMMGLPAGTRLEIVPPEPLEENLTLKEVADKAVAANPEVVEAEQNAVKAHAGLTLSKMAYFPSAAIIGGFANQTVISNAVLPADFTYLGVMATYTVFDGGKREHGIKEVHAQAEMADLAVQLTKAKVAAGVKSSYFELERSRKLSQLARQMVSATRVVEAGYNSDNPEVESAQAKMEAEMFRAELEYRQAFARLKSLMGDK